LHLMIVGSCRYHTKKTLSGPKDNCWLSWVCELQTMK
jgi:hypothetical protein